MSSKTIIGITHGDINGIGYEIILKTFADNRILDNITPVIYGSSKIAAFYRKNIVELQNLNLNVINSASDVITKRINIINCVNDELKVEVGLSTKEAGEAAFLSLEKATEDLKNGFLHAIVTAPINKENIQSDNFNFPGHTEYLEGKFGEPSSSLMMLANDVMRIAVVTGHIPVKDIAAKLSSELILKKLQILNTSLKNDFSIIRPRIAVLGLNPHAGDNGVIGKEEEEIITPAIKQAEKDGILCFGPYPADGFFGAGTFNKFDAVLAMYHDQGLIPFKTIAMESGVNFTAGLSVVRTSPDHGTAYDIAGKNLASENSFRQAVYMAHDIYYNRNWNKEINKNPLRVEQQMQRGGKIE